MTAETRVRDWLRRRDPGLVALRRGLRAAIVMPVVFAVADRVSGDTTVALFAVFGTLALLLLVGFSGSKRDHLVEAGATVAAELALICLGTAASGITWLAVALTAAVTFSIFFLGIRWPALGRTATSLLVSFLLPATLPAPAGEIPSRVLAWLLAGVASLLAVVFLWPVTERQVPPKPPPPDRSPAQIRHAVRAASALGLAVLAAHLVGAQHALWVALGALAVLCSSAAGTSRNVEHALAGTVIGIAVAGGLIALVGAHTAVCWVLLPFVALYTGFAPVGLSFLAGQVGFTTLLLLISNIATPIGWRVGIIRLEDMAIGCVVSLLVGAVFWPRDTTTK